MNKVLSVIVITAFFQLACFQSSNGQELRLLQSFRAGGDAFDAASAITRDSEGNLYVTGSFEGTSSFGNKSLSAAGGRDIFLAKFDSAAALLWVKRFGGQGRSNASSLCTDGEDNIFLCGTFSKDCSFDGMTAKSSDYQDNFIMKVGGDGKVLAAKHIKADSRGGKTAVCSDGAGNIYYAGSFYGKFSADGRKLRSESSSDIFVVKYDRSLNVSEIKQITGFDTDILHDAKALQGRLYLTGSFAGEINLGGSLHKSKGKDDIFIVAFDNFDFAWGKTAGSYYADRGKSIHLINDGIILAGNFSDRVDFGGRELNSAGVMDAFICSYSQDGTVRWASRFGGHSNEYLNAASANGRGDIYVSGSYRGSIETPGGNIESDNFTSDLFLAKFSPEGKLLGAESFGGPGEDYASGLLIDAEDCILQLGEFDRTLNYASGEKQNGGEDDVFIAKFYDCALSEKINLGEDITSCGSEFNIKAEKSFAKYSWNGSAGGNEFKAGQTGEYILRTEDANGCVSEDTVFVKLNALPEINLPETAEICGDGMLSLDAGKGFAAYRWGGGQENRKLKVYESGSYTAEVTDAAGCTATHTVTVTKRKKPEIDAGADVTAERGAAVRFSAEGNFADCRWNGEIKSAVLEVNTAEMSAGSYLYTAVGSDGKACTATDFVLLTVTENSISAEKNILSQNNNNNTAGKMLKIQIFPNPASNEFTLYAENLNAKEDVKLEIYTAEGRLVKTVPLRYKASKNTKNISIEQLSAGKYFVKITNGNTVISKELIKL